MESSSNHTPVKSTAVVKYSANQTPAMFAHLKCNTDLNLPPSNWLSNSANSYGLQNVMLHSTGFSSFRMAHMFPDCVGEVDVVSDAENIKNLLKLPYSRDQVSMMVHRVENTLLIDEFDIYKHLLRTAEKEWEWLRKFFYEHVRQSFSSKDKNLYLHNKSRNVLQQKSLVSKFLYHSLVENGEAGSSGESDEHKPVNLDLSGPVLPDPNMEEEVPDPKSNHKYNRNVVWTFEDIQMLIGTDMPIFGGTTHPCISLRLRDMSSPISVLTGIDYWLDNLMSNVPEVVMCYHLNGIVQKYELVKTEDLPHLENSKFSPNVIRDIAQNILSFLKSNATKAGHTYWLFKGKDDDVVKLYDLTSLCVENDCEQNPFTVPVAMLLYRVARNMKHSSNQKQLGTIRMLLKNSIALLPKEKYPQIVTSSHYMISDLYVPANTDPAAPGLEQMDTDEVESCYEDDLHDADDMDQIMMQLHLGSDCKPNKPNNNFVYKPPPPLSGSLDERCQQALNHVIAGLDCLQYFPFHDENAEELKKKVEHAKRRQEEDNPNMAKPFQVIPMPYTKLVEDQNVKAKEPKTKSRRRNKNKSEVNGNVDTALLIKPNAETIPTWQEPDRSDNNTWKAHLKTLLYEKACLVYATLAEQDYIAEKYGSALRHIQVLIRCQQVLQTLKFSSRTVQESCFFGRAGDSCFMIVKNWEKIEQYREEMTQTRDTYLKIIDEIGKEDISKDLEKKWSGILPQELKSIEQVLLASCYCYERALHVEPVEEMKALYRRLGNVQNELGVFYTGKATENGELFHEFYTKALHFLQSGITSFEAVKDNANLALLYSNMGRLMRSCAHYYSPDIVNKRKLKGQEKHFYNKAMESYQSALMVLGERKSDPVIWDTVSWELSTALFTRATLLQDYPTGIQDESKAEKEVVETLQKALQYCDLDTPGHRQPVYQYRVACIHYRLGTLYHSTFRKISPDNPRCKSIFGLCKLNYEKACRLFKLLEQNMEFLKSQLERVALTELIAKNTANSISKLKHLQYCLHLLVDSIPALTGVLETGKSRTDFKENEPEEASDNNQSDAKKTDAKLFESQAVTFVATVEQQLQFSLKMLTKLCLSKNMPKDCDKLSEPYKALYSMTLKIQNRGTWIENLEKLLEVLNKIKSSNPPLTAAEC